MPIFCVSDLHIGDGGPRDNFAYGGHETEFLRFLDMVQDHRGKLIIIGDLFELWQSNISKVLTHRMVLLERLAAMSATYVLGNHDVDLFYFIENGWLAQAHPFFNRMYKQVYRIMGEQTFRFMHGHQADKYCCGENPGLGRITAIYAGLKEDRNGSPMLDKYRTVEDRAIGRLESLVSVWNRLRGKPDRFTAINRNLLRMILGSEIIICGHTHKPGRIGKWLYNCGTWAERINSYVCINNDGTAGVYDWYDGTSFPNDTQLAL